MLELAISYLNNQKYQDIILYRFKDKKTLGEISEIYGISKDRVRQLINKIIKLLKRNRSEVILRYGMDIDIKNVKDIDINCLDLSTRSYNVLLSNDLIKLKDIMELNIDEIAHIRGLGRKSFVEIIDKIKNFGYKVPNNVRTFTLYNRCMNEKKES